MKTEKNRKLHGSVLLTVVAVMALLIIFMTGTLVLANAANRRSHRSYTSNQAEYTARAAINAFYETCQANADIEAAVVNLGENVVYPTIDFGTDTGIGHLISPDGVGPDGALRVERLNDASGNAITQWKWNIGDLNEEDGSRVNARWEEFNIYRVTATVQVGQRGAVKTMYQDYLGNPVAGVIPPTPHTYDENGGIDGFQTVGFSEFNLTGGTLETPVILGLALPDRSNSFTPQNSSETYSKMFFVNGDLHTGAQLYMHYTSPDFATVITNDFYCDNEFVLYVEYNDSDLPDNFTQLEVPYFFVNGTFHYNRNQLYMGTGYGMHTGNQAPFNVFMGTADITCSGPVHIAGDLYLMDDGGDNVISGGSSSKLYSWTKSMDISSGSQFTPEKTGSIYCNGNLEYNAGGEISGDLRVKGTLTINANEPLTIHGNVVADTIVINGDRIVSIVDGSATFYNNISGTNATAIAEFTSLRYGDYDSFGEPAYPDTMTREEIYGIDPAVEGANYIQGFIPAPSRNPEDDNYDPNSNKLIENQLDLLKAAKYNKDTGSFEGYITELSDLTEGYTDDDGNDHAPRIHEKNASNTYGPSWSPVTGSNELYIPHDAALSGTLTITPVGSDYWIIIGDPHETTTFPLDFKLVIDDSSSATVNILIQGDLELSTRSGILVKSLYDRAGGGNVISEVNQNTDIIRLNMYSNDYSTLKMSGAIVTANAYAPFMKLEGTTEQGWKVQHYYSKYTDEDPQWIGSGNTVQWIGNGLFSDLSAAFNNFSFLKLDAAE